jgi:hypothetical protein
MNVVVEAAGVLAPDAIFSRGVEISLAFVADIVGDNVVNG